MEKEGGLLFCRGCMGLTRDHWHRIFLVDGKPVIKWEFLTEANEKYQISDEYWEQVHNLDYLVENFKRDPVDTERHINFRVQDANSIYSREEVERQHKAWHERQKGKEKVMGELEEVLAIIDDDSTNPEGAELTDKQKAELKEVVKKAFEDA